MVLPLTDGTSCPPEWWDPDEATERLWLQAVVMVRTEAERDLLAFIQSRDADL